MVLQPNIYHILPKNYTFTSDLFKTKQQKTTAFDFITSLEKYYTSVTQFVCLFFF